MAAAIAGEDDWRALAEGLLARAGLAGDPIVEIASLAGGVSSDIVRVRLGSGRQLVAKRALARLKVAADWQAPVVRNHYEALWLRRAAALSPGLAPALLAEDEAAGAMLMAYLPEAEYGNWKSDLLAGRLDERVAPALGAMLGALHAATWERPDLAAEFSTDALFDALRLDPYLRSLARDLPELARPILDCAEATAATHLALVHGDVSPKNILVARADSRPVLLDAECAWYGDPAFDAAFLVNHLLLKSVHLPALRARLFAAATRFLAAWSAALPATGRKEAERRCAVLVPCLMLARIDGKSPVEYLREGERDTVRRLARGMILAPPGAMDELIGRAAAGLDDGQGRAP